MSDAVSEAADHYRERDTDDVSAAEFLHTASWLGVRAGLLLCRSGLRPHRRLRAIKESGSRDT